jgi:hypothetical protein
MILRNWSEANPSNPSSGIVLDLRSNKKSASSAEASLKEFPADRDDSVI